jgi:hypothetical protein
MHVDRTAPGRGTDRCTASAELGEKASAQPGVSVMPVFDPGKDMRLTGVTTRSSE